MSDYFNQHYTNSHFLSFESWVILSDIEQSIKNKIEAVGTPLKDWDITIYRGISTGYNEAFIIDGRKKRQLIEKDPNSSKIIRPLLRGRDIKNYSYEFADLYLITTFPSLKINIEEYIAVKEHLMSFGYDRLKQTGDIGSRKKTNNQWFEIQDSISYWEDFSKQKIVWKRVGSILKFSFDDSGALALDSACFATGSYIKYLLAILNSSFGKYLMKDSPKTGTGDLLISVQAIEPLSIPIPNLDDNEKIIALIDQILLNYNDYDKEITKSLDRLIYSQFNFTQEEREFIESE